MSAIDRSLDSLLRIGYCGTSLRNKVPDTMLVIARVPRLAVLLYCVLIGFAIMDLCLNESAEGDEFW